MHQAATQRGQLGLESLALSAEAGRGGEATPRLEAGEGTGQRLDRSEKGARRCPRLSSLHPQKLSLNQELRVPAYLWGTRGGDQPAVALQPMPRATQGGRGGL